MCRLEEDLEIEINTQKRICTSRLSVTKNHYMMHGQQNVKLIPTFAQYSTTTTTKTFEATQRLFDEMFIENGAGSC